MILQNYCIRGNLAITRLFASAETIVDKDADPEQAKCQTLAFMAEWLPSLYASSFRAFAELEKRIPVHLCYRNFGSSSQREKGAPDRTPVHCRALPHPP